MDAILSGAGSQLAGVSAGLERLRALLDDPSSPFATTFREIVEVGTTCHPARLESTRKLVFSAIGKSGVIAELVVAMLQSCGVRSAFLHPTEAVHGDLGLVGEGDVVLLLSNNGRSAELLQLLPHFHARTCLTVALTAQSASPLASACRKTLLLPQVDEGCPFGMAPLSSSIIALAVGQLLVGSILRCLELPIESYARNHPGGDIGKRIFVRTSDVMVPPPRLPRVAPEATFQECISSMTSHALGALVVTDADGLLLGLIGERDLRVGMEKWRAGVFERCASELMNPAPTVTQAEGLAVDALAKMESGTKVLNFLPVIDESRRCVGLVRLVDLHQLGISVPV